MDADALMSSLEAVMDRRLADLMARLDDDRAAREKRNKQRQEQLLAVVAKTLNERLPKQVTSMVVRAINDELVPALGGSIATAVEAAVSEHMGTVAPSVSQAVVHSVNASLPGVVGDALAARAGDLAGDVQHAFQREFAESVVPAFERGTQDMLEQISDVFMKGVNARVEVETRASSELTAAVSQSRDLLSRVEVTAASLSEQLREAQAVLREQGSELQRLQTSLLEQPRQAAPVAAPAPAPAPVPAPAPAPAPAPVPAPAPAPAPKPAAAKPTTPIPHAIESMRAHPAASKLMQMARVEGLQATLEGALNEGNANLVTWLCLQLFGTDTSAPQFRDGTAFQDVSQFVLLCLVQQLGTDLSTLPLHKLTWLHAAFEALDPNDADIAAYVCVCVCGMWRWRSLTGVVWVNSVLGSVVSELRNHMLENAGVLAAAGSPTTAPFRKLSVAVNAMLRR